MILIFVVISNAAPVSEQKSDEYAELVFESNPEEKSEFYEGDIELQPGENPLHRNAIVNKNRRWPNGTVPYEISTNYTANVQQIFMEAMIEIEERTKINGRNCIHFKPHSGEKAFLKFVKGSGCHTPVGNSGSQTSVTLGVGCEIKGTVIHELLHALGFWHEQSRSDRDQYVTIHSENIKKGHEANFNKYTTDFLGQPYDYGSIMHYSAYAFTSNPSLKTIEPKQPGVLIGQRRSLSSTDIKEIQLLYDCIVATRSIVESYVTDPGSTAR